jgi:hypothetical protein
LIDDTTILEQLDPAQARGGGEAHLVGQFDIGHAGIALQCSEDTTVDGVEGFWHFRLTDGFFVAGYANPCAKLAIIASSLRKNCSILSSIQTGADFHGE